MDTCPFSSFLRTVALACLVVGAGCSSKKSNGAGGTSGTNTGSAGTTGAGNSGGGATTGCAQSALTILFNPMYSAYDGVHTFQLPAVVNGIDPTNVEVSWSAADPSMVQMEQDPVTGGVMLTMQKAGNTTIYAQAGGLCGAAPLTITAASPDDWMAGSTRYNDGVTISIRNVLGRGRDAGSLDGGVAANEAACTNCHGDTANGPFKDVAHTPEQTGGFSDQDLVNIFEHGMVPMGGYFDTAIVPYATWQTFHQWDPGTAEKGLVVYLRSLAPATQMGASNFGGRFDGGIPDGGFQRGDGGFGRDGGGFRDGGGIRDGGFGMRDAAPGQ